MKKTLLLTTFCAALTACGGGSGGSNGSGPTPTPTTQCTLPTIASSTTYYGITPGGGFGQWQFTQSADGKTLTVLNMVTTHGHSEPAKTFSATANSSNCAFITTEAGIQGIATAFNATGDIAVSAAQAAVDPSAPPQAAVNRPALLITNPITNVAMVDGTYYVVNFEKEGNNAPTSSYRKLVMATDGTGIIYRWNPTNSSWEARHQIGIADLAPGTGLFYVSILANPTYGDLTSEEVGVAMFKGSGSSKVMGLSVMQAFATPSIEGMWIGSTDSTNSPAGYYVDNTYDDSAYTNAWTGGVTVTSTTIQPSNGNAITYQMNQPQTGFIGLPVDAGMPVDSWIGSALGVFAATTQTDPNVGPVNTVGGPSITFGVRPQQQ